MEKEFRSRLIPRKGSVHPILPKIPQKQSALRREVIEEEPPDDVAQTKRLPQVRRSSKVMSRNIKKYELIFVCVCLFQKYVLTNASMKIFWRIIDWLKRFIFLKIYNANESTYPFPNFSGATVEVWEWISYFTPHFEMYVITHLWKYCRWHDEKAMLFSQGGVDKRVWYTGYRYFLCTYGSNISAFFFSSLTTIQTDQNFIDDIFSCIFFCENLCIVNKI